MSGRLETAFRVIVDAHTRDLYDQWLEGLAGGEDVPPQDAAHQTPDTSPMTNREAGRAPRAAEDREPSPARPSAPVHETPGITGDQQVNDILASASQCDGSVIARVRAARGMTLQQISSSTKISQMNLQCIEADDFASLPPSVFLRGFLQQIARCLSVDAHAVVDAYMVRFERWQATTRGGEPGF
jgi:hypothetical protein